MQQRQRPQGTTPEQLQSAIRGHLYEAARLHGYGGTKAVTAYTDKLGWGTPTIATQGAASAPRLVLTFRNGARATYEPNGQVILYPPIR